MHTRKYHRFTSSARHRTCLPALVAAWGVLALLAPFVDSRLVQGEEASSEPKPIPVTRLEVKQALERLKFRAPRLPFPESADGGEAREGERRVANNGRMRRLYLPAEMQSGGFSARQDPNMTLDYAFATELFWIVSRVNNCHYCLGHQENKLLSAGLDDDAIASLDGDWELHSPERQAAYAFTRKLTLAPHAISDADVLALREAFQSRPPLQPLEVLFLVSRYNATNRWTDALGIPQEDHRTFLTFTSPRFEDKPTRVAVQQVPERPGLPDRETWTREVTKIASRSSRFPLVDEDETRQWLGWSEGSPLPRHAQLLAHFPETGKMWMAYLIAAEEQGELEARRRSEIAWLAARHDHAWYAQAVARDRLHRLGYSDEQIFALDQVDRLEPSVAAVLNLTRRLTVVPQEITDEDIAAVRQHYSPHETAEIVHHITLAAFFNRLTEAAQLPWDHLDSTE